MSFHSFIDALFRCESPMVMGILNVTPDSFFSDSRCASQEEILLRVTQMVAEGADCLDVGGCSTRPGSDTVPEEEEFRRMDAALRVVCRHFPELPLSVDTFRASVVQRLFDRYGAFIVNDISAGEDDPAMIDTVARLQLPYIAMHKRGTPKTMPLLTAYEDVVVEVKTYLQHKLEELSARGIRRVMLDPGFGFAKTVEQNYALFRHIATFAQMGVPLLVGISRKGMLWKPLGITHEEALCSTAALNLQAMLRGAHMIRVHDVKEARQMVSLAALLNPR
jgi:dihydropteroate synthase